MKRKPMPDRSLVRRRGHLNDESGMLLVVTMLILLIVSATAAASLINSYLERSLARNQNYASIAQNAADAGITAGLAWLNDADTPAAEITGLTTAWAEKLSDDFSLTTRTGQGEAGVTFDQTRLATFTTFLRQKPDEQDIDGDGDVTEKVLYNSCMAGNDCFKYANSTYKVAGAGYPVIQIKSEGRFGEGGIREVILEIGRDKFDVKAKGAVTASASVLSTGTIQLDGSSHDINGAPGGNCTESFSGVSLPCPTKDINSNCICDVADGDVCATYTAAGASGSTGKLDLNGDGDFLDPGEDPAPASPSNTDPSISPDDALGLDEGDLAGKIGGALPAPGTFTISGSISYYNQDFLASGGGTGILIVHNPLFEPQKWEVSDPAAGPKYAALANLTCAERTDPTQWVAANDVVGYPSLSTLQPLYDPKLDTSCPTADAVYRAAAVPRVLSMNANDTFKGVIIADMIDKINGTADIIGAVISLSTVSIDTLGNGSANIKYSCDALNIYTDVGYSIKLNWHRTR